MNSTSSPVYRVAIVGGGIIGCVSAYYLARAGVDDIVIVEREGIASGASGYSAGLLTPYSGSNDPGLLALSESSLQLHAELAHELPDITGIDYGYTLKPYMRCAFGELGYDKAISFMQQRLADGLDAEWLTGSESRELCNWLSDEVSGACVTTIEPSVDSRLLTLSALKAAQISGARICEGSAVGFSGREGKPDAVKLADGTVIPADAIVIAMGPWTNRAGDWLGYEVPVFPQKGELLYVHFPSDKEGEMGQNKPPAIMHNMDDGGVIFPRRISPTVLGATKEDGRGYDREPSDYAWEFILPRVQRLTDKIDRCSVTHHTACLRPKPGDGKPYVGKAPGWDNVYIASGHWSEGIHYAPLTGKAISDLISVGMTSIDISAISADRLAV